MEQARKTSEEPPAQELFASARDHAANLRALVLWPLLFLEIKTPGLLRAPRAVWGTFGGHRPLPRSRLTAVPHEAILYSVTVMFAAFY